VRSLIWKELRSLKPFLALVFFFIALSAVNVALTEYPDQYPLSKILEANEGDEVITFIVAFALASGLLVREREEGTLAFLDALPVSRTQIFVCKVLLALAVLWLMPLSDLLIKAAVHAWSRTSLEKHFQWQPLWMGTGLDMASCFVYFSIGLALSFLKRFSLLVVGICICLYLLLQELRTPWVSLFNIFTLSEPVFQGQRWLLPSTKLAAQLAMAFLALTGAWGAFLKMGDAAQRLADRVKRSTATLLLVGLGTAGLVLIWAGLAVYWIQKSNQQDRTEVHFSEWALGRTKTARYSFVYPLNETTLANQLADHADEVEAKVRTFLAAQPITRIEADLTGSAPETSGLAHWKKVQMDLVGARADVPSLLAVLGHETTHVYIDSESQARIGDYFNSTRFFHEGLASYVEYHLFRPPQNLSSLLRVAAVMRARDEVKLEELLDDEALQIKLDSDLVYPLGEVFANALIDRYGPAAPGRVVGAFARPNAPKGLAGVALWQDVLQACGYNLTDVEDAFFLQLDQAVASYRPFINSLPRLRGAVQWDRRRLLIRPSYEGDVPGRLICRFRAQAHTPPRLYEMGEVEPGVGFWVDAAVYPERSFWYQLGWQVKGASQPIYEPWVEARRER
jgi:hypothetical protein